MVKCATLTTSAGNLIGDSQNLITASAHGGSTLLEKVMKMIGKIATASAVAFSAFALTVTPGSAARVGRSMTPPQQYCMYYDEGGTDCSFISYAQCWATASGQAGGCYANSPSDDEGFRGARAQMSRPRY